MFKWLAKWILKNEMQELELYRGRGGITQWWHDESYRLCWEYEKSEIQRKGGS